MLLQNHSFRDRQILSQARLAPDPRRDLRNDLFPNRGQQDSKGLEATPETKNFDTFTSALSIPDDDTYGNDNSNIHIMYGVIKDFGMGGMQLRFLVTQNKMLRSLISKLG